MPEENKPVSKIEGALPQKSSIRTYENDAAEAMRTEKTSLGSVFLAEQEKKFSNSQYFPQEKTPRTKIYFAIGILLVFVSAGLLWWSWGYLTRDQAEVASKPSALGAVIPDTNITIDTTKLSSAEIETKIIESKSATKLNSGNVNTFVFTEKTASTTIGLSSKDFVSKISWRMDGKLFRSLSPRYSVGYYGEEIPQFFTVFALSSYEEAFAGTLLWEKFIYDDLKPLLSEEIDPTSTSTPIMIFKDKIIDNKDTRVLFRDDKIVLIYSFPDRKTLVIAGDERTFRSVLSHLSPDRFIQ